MTGGCRENQLQRESGGEREDWQKGRKIEIQQDDGSQDMGEKRWRRESIDLGQ